MSPESSTWLRAVLCGGLICAGIILFSGSQQGGVQRYQRGLVSSSFFFYIEIINRTFNSSLLNPTTDYYKSLKAEVEALMDGVYNCSSCATKEAYDGIKDMSFSNGSSVIVKMTLIFQTIIINPVVVKYLFINSVIANPPSDLHVDLEYTRDVQTPVIATTTTASPTTPMLTRSPLVNTTTVEPTTSSRTTSSHKPASSSAIIPVSTASTTQPNATKGLSTPSSLPPSSVHNTPDKSATTPKSENQGGTAATQGSGSGSNHWPYWFDWVPGWGIAILVLAAVILLFLILLFILLLVRWFCMKKEKSSPPAFQPIVPSAPSPAYLSHFLAPATKDLSYDHPDAPKRNKTGLYVLNP